MKKKEFSVKTFIVSHLFLSLVFLFFILTLFYFYISFESFFFLNFNRFIFVDLSSFSNLKFLFIICLFMSSIFGVISEYMFTYFKTKFINKKDGD